MQRHYQQGSSGPIRQPRRSPVRTSIAAMLLAFGAILARLAQLANGLAYRWADDTTVRAWAKATRAFRSMQGRANQLPRWEQTLLRVGPPVLLAIGAALALLWILVLVGGVLAWLALQGYGFLLMLGAVLIGVLMGYWRARLSVRLPDQDGLN